MMKFVFLRDTNPQMAGQEKGHCDKIRKLGNGLTGTHLIKAGGETLNAQRRAFFLK